MAQPFPANRIITSADIPTPGMNAAQRVDKQKRLCRKMFRAYVWLEEHDNFYDSKTQKYQQQSQFSDWTGAPIQCVRCIAGVKNGARCTRSVCASIPICWQHAQSLMNLRGGQTSLKKNHERLKFGGLFACQKKKPATHIVFHAGDIICGYFGESIDEETLNERYGEGDTPAPYALQVGQGQHAFFEDSALRRSFGSLVNTILEAHNNYDWAAASAGIQPNAKIGTIAIDGREMACIIATRSIKNSQEIFVRSHDQHGNPEYIFHTDAELTHRTKGYKPAARACKL
jgi:hypothetical protein